ncbi:recombinase family protein [Leucobacter albus]|uniref:Recombinase family protein n=1 Tax=Leucobacter albus TaxID=272210 RepID=A0ABW3TRE2_9MICO
MTIYGYARTSTSKQELGLDAQTKALKDSGCDEIIQDANQKGMTALRESPVWLELNERLVDGDVLKIYSSSRLGRKSYEVQYVVGMLIERGITVYILDRNLTLDNLDNLDQSISLAFSSVVDHNENVARNERTRAALQVKKDAKYKLGRPPSLRDKEIELILTLHNKGLGAKTICKLVEVKRASGKTSKVAAATVRKVIAGDYQSREEWERYNKSRDLALLRGTN